LAVAIAETTDGELTPADRQEQAEIVACELVEATMTTAVVVHRPHDLLQAPDRRRRVVERPEEFQVTPV
jgi:hypothetical protein